MNFKNKIQSVNKSNQKLFSLIVVIYTYNVMRHFFLVKRGSINIYRNWFLIRSLVTVLSSSLISCLNVFGKHQRICHSTSFLAFDVVRYIDRWITNYPLTSVRFLFKLWQNSQIHFLHRCFLNKSNSCRNIKSDVPLVLHLNLWYCSVFYRPCPCFLYWTLSLLSRRVPFDLFH